MENVSQVMVKILSQAQSYDFLICQVKLIFVSGEKVTIWISNSSQCVQIPVKPIWKFAPTFSET